MTPEQRLMKLSEKLGKPPEKILEEALELYEKLATYRAQPPRPWRVFS